MKKYFKFLKFCFELNYKIVLIYFLLAFFSIFTPYLYIKVFSEISNKIIINLNKNFNMGYICLYLGLLVLISMYMWFFESIENYIKNSFEVTEDSVVTCKKLTKIYKINQEEFENIETSNLIYRVCNSDRNIISLTFTSIIGIIILFFQSIIYFYMIFKLNRVVSCILVVIFVPMFYLANKFGKENYDFNKEFTYKYRKANYIYSMFIEKEFAKEKELFKFGNSYIKKWSNIDKFIRNKYYKINLKWYGFIKLSNIITEIIVFIIIFFILINFKNKNVDIGFTIAFISTISRFINSISWNVPYYLKDISEGMEYYNDLENFFVLKTEKSESDKTIEKLKKIEFKNVNFKYPNSKNFILKDVSLKFEDKKHYALVGINGSGKSTVVKLILRFFNDFKGNILINNESILNFSYDSLRDTILVLNQDFVKYDLSFKDNITLGKEYNKEKFEKILEQLNLFELVKKLKNGIDTNLGKFDIGSSDLSGGEWQKIAFARLLYRDASFYIFDEPISSLDAISEKDFVDSINKYFKDKMCLIVSHRFSVIKDCDFIYVIQDGEISQIGKHDYLIKENGLYREMFESQRGLFYD